MRKTILTFLAFAAVMTARSEVFAYLTFETTDGVRCSVLAEGLEIVFKGSTLCAGGKSLTVSNLSRMYFSDADETTGISSATVPDGDAPGEIYDLNGRKVAAGRLSSIRLPHGVYLVKTSEKTYKMTVR